MAVRADVDDAPACGREWLFQEIRQEKRPEIVRGHRSLEPIAGNLSPSAENARIVDEHIDVGETRSETVGQVTHSGQRREVGQLQRRVARAERANGPQRSLGTVRVRGHHHDVGAILHRDDRRGPADAGASSRNHDSPRLLLIHGPL